MSEPLEPLRGAFEVAATEVARAGRRPEGGVGEPDPLGEDVELLLRLVEARGEARRVEKAPEVVPRVREMRRRGGGDTSGIDAAEDDPEVRAEDVGDGVRQAASGSRASSRSSKRRRRSSPET